MKSTSSTYFGGVLRILEIFEVIHGMKDWENGKKETGGKDIMQN
jgi:hypothetical protein